MAASENWYLAAEPRLGRLTERWSSAKRATYLRTPFFEARLPAFTGARHPAATSRRLLTVIVNWPALMRNGSAAHEGRNFELIDCHTEGDGHDHFGCVRVRASSLVVHELEAVRWVDAESHSLGHVDTFPVAPLIMSGL